MDKYKKNNITVELRVPIKTAISIIGRLYGSGVLSRTQYYNKLAQIDKKAAKIEQQKIEKMDKILSKIAQKQPK